MAATDFLRQQAVLLDPRRSPRSLVSTLIRVCVTAKLSPDGRWLATSTWGGSNVKVWDTARRTLAWELPCGSAIAAFSLDGRWLVTSTDHEYRLWHVGSWRPGIEIRSVWTSMAPSPSRTTDGCWP